MGRVRNVTHQLVGIGPFEDLEFPSDICTDYNARLGGRRLLIRGVARMEGRRSGGLLKLGMHRGGGKRGLVPFDAADAFDHVVAVMADYDDTHRLSKVGIIPKSELVRRGYVGDVVNGQTESGRLNVFVRYSCDFTGHRLEGLEDCFIDVRSATSSSEMEAFVERQLGRS